MATQSVATISVRPCVMTTPFGTPVVPEVKRMSDGSSGPSAALRRSTSARAAGVASARKSCHDSAEPSAFPLATTIVWSAGSGGAGCPRAWPRSPCPRKSVTVTRTRAPLRERTTAASAPLNRVFTGTRTAPAANRPSAATVHSAQLPHQMATRSPGSTPAATRAAPNSRAASARSAYVRLVAPSRTATRSANCAGRAADHGRDGGPGRQTAGLRRSPADRRPGRRRPLRMVLFPYNNDTFERRPHKKVGVRRLATP